MNHKGGMPGFVRVAGPSELVFPDYDGNGMFLSLGNISVNPHVGLLFIDFEKSKRLRVNGTATFSRDDPLIKHSVGAQLIVRVKARALFPNCPRYIHKMQLVERSSFVPRADAATPVPAWKRMEWSCDVLPKNPRCEGRVLITVTTAGPTLRTDCTMADSSVITCT